MTRKLGVASILFAFSMAFAVGSFAQVATTSDDGPIAPEESWRRIARSIAEEPADANAMARFLNATKKRYVETRRSDPAAARRLLQDADAALNKVDAASKEAEAARTDARETLAFYRRMLEADTADAATWEDRLLRNPNDFETFLIYGLKFQMDDQRLYEKESEATALARLDHVAEVLKTTSAATSNSDVEEEARSLSLRIEEYLKPRVRSAQERLSLVDTVAALPPADGGTWLNGAPLGAEDLVGKVVLLDFWALWCGPCIDGMPKVQRWNEKYASQGLAVVAVVRAEEESNDSGKSQIDRIDALFEEKDLKFRCFVDDGSLFEAYRVSGVPHYAVIDRDGRVRTVRTGGGMSLDDLQESIQDALGTPSDD